MSGTTAGTPSVRLALPAEAGAIAALQRRVWQADPDLHGLLESMSVEEMTQTWWRAIATPPLAELRVLVALDPGEEGPRVRAFATIGPSEDQDAEPTDALVAEFVVDLDHRGRGHGSRLLNAVVDTLRADRFTRATWWLRTTDDTLRAFLSAAGWQADGAHRQTGTEDGTVQIREVRLHTWIGE
ncbi:GNAT family N-acetyltransferase [Acidipropionibacterium jensenii]|uniref:GNAT family N-acetyltransferase n=1 Tax=Acidipropionibacterium jensenii TaxID=1749 RepID=UPI00110A0CEA|nr:GNAT family N-acetyltransferase [Acidipropionibacterium jensenii]QCV88601.1 GNAT family N-acetyltransferase [Acidipropionibacterium jensenii]